MYLFAVGRAEPQLVVELREHIVEERLERDDQLVDSAQIRQQLSRLRLEQTPTRDLFEEELVVLHHRVEVGRLADRVHELLPGTFEYLCMCMCMCVNVAMITLH